MLNFIGTLCIAITLLYTVVAQASPQGLGYQGRIIRSDNTALEYNSVSFLFQITDPSGQCIIYKEQVNGINMTNSKGVFDVPIGSGTVIYPMTGSFKVLDAFNNTSAFLCLGGTTYNASQGDLRKLQVQFHDGVGWNQITPDSVIRSVPFAAYSLAAEKLGSNSAADFILKTGVPNCIASGKILSADASGFTCVTDQAGTSGAVTSVTGNGPITATGTGTVSIAATVGQTSGTLAAGDDSRFASLASDITTLTTAVGGKISQSQFPASCLANQTLTFMSPSGAFTCSNIALTGAQVSGNISGNAAGFSGALSGDVTGNQGTTKVVALQNKNISTTAPTDGQVLQWNNTSSKWEPTTLPASSGGTITGVTAGSGLTGGGSTGSISLAVNSGVSANQIVQLDGSAKLPAVDGSALANLNPVNLSSAVPVNKGGTGVSSLTANRLIASDGTGSSMIPFSCSTSELLTFNASGVMGCTSYSSTAFFMNGGNSFGAAASFGTNDNYNLNLKTNGSTKMTILAGGYVGIGKTTPTNLLDLESNVAASSTGVVNKNLNSAGGAYLNAAAGTNSISIGTWGPTAGGTVTYIESNSANGLNINTFTNTAIKFATNTAGGVNERMRITQTGDVGVGTTTPATKLEVAGEVKLGNSSTACSGTNEGAQRYNATTKTMQFCNGTNWTEFGGGPEFFGGAMGGTCVITVNADSGSMTNLSTCNFTFTPTKSGTARIETYLQDVFIFTAGTAGHLTFHTQLNGTNGSDASYINVSYLNRYGVGTVLFPPVVDRWTVSAGTTYVLTIQYWSQGFAGGMSLNTGGNSSGKYVHVTVY